MRNNIKLILDREMQGISIVKQDKAFVHVIVYGD